MQSQIERLSAQLGEKEEIKDEVKQQPQQAISLTERLTSNIVSKMPYATDMQKHKASQIITHLLAKVSANPQVFGLFTDKNNIADAVRIVTQIVSLELPLSGDMYYIIPYKDKLSLQISYQGMLEIAYRAGVYNVQVNTVFEGDDFEYYFSATNHFIHKPHNSSKDPVCYYATCKVLVGKDTDLLLAVMTHEQMLEFKNKYSRGNPLWKSEFEKMAKKTVLKQLLKLCPKRPIDNELLQEIGVENDD